MSTRRLDRRALAVHFVGPIRAYHFTVDDGVPVCGWWPPSKSVMPRSTRDRAEVTCDDCKVVLFNLGLEASR